MGPEDLAEIISHLPRAATDKLLVGIEHADDAGVYPVSDNLALVQTLDFITPIVDDPFRFGRIAAANSLSDVYAMGGRPLTALNICCFPPRMDKEHLAAVLLGGHDAIEEAGAVLVGGHTIKDGELKYGLSVTGSVHPQAVLPNSAARAGDVLVLTKPLGTATLFAGMGKGLLSVEDLEPAIVGMMTLNRLAAETLPPYVEQVDNRRDANPAAGVHALTDVTGFGLAGHAHEIAAASGLQIDLFGSHLPEYPGARSMIASGQLCGGSRGNRKALEKHADFGSASEEDIWLACDAQTSGGLLIAVAESDADSLLADLHAAGVSDAAVVGQAGGGESGTVRVVA